MGGDDSYGDLSDVFVLGGQQVFCSSCCVVVAVVVSLSCLYCHSFMFLLLQLVELINSYEPKTRGDLGKIQDHEYCQLAHEIIQTQEQAIVQALDGEVCLCSFLRVLFVVEFFCFSFVSQSVV